MKIYRQSLARIINGEVGDVVAKKDITTLLGSLEFIRGQDELLTIASEVDPIFEILERKFVTMTREPTGIVFRRLPATKNI